MNNVRVATQRLVHKYLIFELVHYDQFGGSIACIIKRMCSSGSTKLYPWNRARINHRYPFMTLRADVTPFREKQDIFILTD